MNNYNLGREFDEKKRDISDEDMFEIVSDESFVSLASSRSATSTGSQEVNVSLYDEMEDEARFVSFYEGLGWRQVVFIPHNTFWRCSLVLTIILHYFNLVYGYHFTNDETKITFYTKTGMVLLIVGETMYAVDTILSIVYKNWKTIYMVNVNSPRPTVQIFCDVLALLPIEYIYWEFSSRSTVKMRQRVNIYYCLTSHSLIRIYRVFTFFSDIRKNLAYQNVWMRALEMITYVALMSHAFSAVLFIFYCRKKDETCYSKAEDWSRRFLGGGIETDFDWYITSFYVMASKCTFKGFSIFPPDTLSKLLFIVVYLTSFVLLYGFMLGEIVSAQIHEMHNMFSFTHRIMLIKRILSQLKSNKKTYNDIITYYQVLWENREGVHQNNLHYELLPNILHRDLNLDVFGDAFKRSHLFRKTNESFLSFLCLKMKAEFYMPGDILYRKGSHKTKMVYLVTGIIQILSDEDDESPIISFSGGTCIGEAALFYHCLNTVVVRCATYCEVQVLEKKDFHSVLKNYPKLHHEFKVILQERVKKCKALKAVGARGLQADDVVQLEDADENAVKWLKNFFQTTMLARKRRNLALQSVLRFKSVNADVSRTARYLDMYVFTEQLELTTDDVCLRTTCPWILQPKSVVLRTWNNIIVMTAVFAALLLPYYAFYGVEEPEVFSPLMYGVEILFIMDVMVQMSTAIKTKTELIAEWKQIFYVRISEFGFIADVLVAFPFEVMDYMLYSHGYRDLGNIFMLNKLIKLWKVERFFQEQEATRLNMTYFLREVKHLFYVIYLIYIFGGIFYFQSCFHSSCQSPGWYTYYTTNFLSKAESGYYSNFTISTLYSAIVIVGNSYLTVVPISGRDFVFTTLAMLISFVFIFYIFSASAAMKLLGGKNWSQFQDMYKTIQSYMKEHKMDSVIERRVLDHLDFCWELDNAYHLITGRSPMYDLSPHLRERMYLPALGPYLAKLPMFKDTKPQFLAHLAIRSKTLILQPDEVVTYRGEPATAAYIIMNGYCQTFSNFTKNNAIELIGPHSVFNAVEMCTNLPNINTVRTVTCCQMIQLELKDLVLALKRSPSSENIYQDLVSNCAEWKDIPELNMQNSKNTTFKIVKTQDLNYSWFKFHNRESETGRPDKDGFQQPFNHLGYFNFIKFLLLQRTIVPNGWFMIGWEISRAIFAGISALLFPVAGALEVYTFPSLIYIRYALDVTAIVDIYMRLHVAFFDHRGLVVSHPLSTAKHYLTNGFLIDFLAIFPFELFGLGKGDDYTLYYYLLFNRVLQIHRIVGLLNYCRLRAKFARNYPALFNAVKFLIFGMISCNTCGGFLVLIRCKYTLDVPSPGKFNKGIYCEQWNFLFEEYKFAEPLSPIRVYLYSVYFATSLITRCGLAGTVIVNNNNALAVVAMSVFGLWMLKFMYATSIATTSSEDVKTTTHQEKMQSLLQFIKTKKITKDLREDVIEYFELLWKRKRAKEAYDTFSGFHLTLREDLLLHIYGQKLLECSVFATASRSFLCKLIIHCQVEIFLKGTTILRPYEITTTIYFINKGKVDLIVAGNVKACSSLIVGCLFGNLTNALNYSHSFTVVARGHVEVLAIPSKMFHEQLALHPKVQKTFSVAVEKSPSDFYTSTGTNQDQKGSSITFAESSQDFTSTTSKYSRANGPKAVLEQLICNTAMLPESQFIKVMTAIQLATSYITFFTCSYAFGFGIDSWYFGGFLIATDLIFYFRIYMNFKLAYYDEFGYLVIDPLTIAKRYLKFGFIYDIVAVFPFDLIVAFVPDDKRLVWWQYVRVNRMLTSIYVLQWFWIQNNKLNIKVFRMRFGFCAVWMTMSLHTLTLIFCLFRCIEQGTCNDTNDNIMANFLDYYNGMCDIISIFTGSSLTGKELMPNTPLLIIYCIIVMIVTQILVSWFVGAACAILESTNRTMTYYTGKVKNLCRFYVTNYLSQQLLDSLWSYLSMLWRVKKGEQVPELLKHAPYYIREGIKTSMYGEYVQANPIFAACHDDFLRQLVTCLKQYTFFPGNYITFAGDMNASMYFVYSGEVEFLVPVEKYEDEDVRGILYEGDAFGMTQGVFPKREHQYHYRARTMTVLLILTRTDWENMLDNFPAVKKEIFNKAESLNYD